MVSHKVAPAIATNNCVVCKPTELTPLTALALADILYEAGLPPEMFQVVTGWPDDIGDEMVTNANIEVITFTGGVRVGKLIAAKAGYKRAALELGGNDPLIILDDLSRQRPRQGGGAGGRGRHQKFRPALHGGEAHPGSGARRRQLRARWFWRRPRRSSSAIRWTPTPISARVVHEEAAKTLRRPASTRPPSRAPRSSTIPAARARCCRPSRWISCRTHSELVFEETFGPIIPIVRVPNDDAEVDPHFQFDALRAFLGRVHQPSRPHRPDSSRASMSARSISGKCRVTASRCRPSAGSRTRAMA